VSKGDYYVSPRQTRSRRAGAETLLPSILSLLLQNGKTVDAMKDVHTSNCYIFLTSAEFTFYSAVAVL